MSERVRASIAAMPTRQANDADRARTGSAHSTAFGDAGDRSWSPRAAPAQAPVARHAFGDGSIRPNPTAQSQPVIAKGDDAYEIEAERAADLALAKGPMTASSSSAATGTSAQSNSFSETPVRVQARAAQGETPQATPELPHQIRSAAPEGRSLPTEQRAFFEERLGHDFSTVKIHAGPAASEAAASVKAQAFTHGQDIYFGQNYYRPAQAEGQRLMAHELAHTAQQRPNVIARRALDDAASDGGSDVGSIRSRGADDESSQPPGAVADQIGSVLENDPSDTSGNARDRLSQLPPSSRTRAAAVLHGRELRDQPQLEGQATTAVPKDARPSVTAGAETSQAQAGGKDSSRRREERPGTPQARAAQSGVAAARSPSVASGSTAPPAASPTPPSSVTTPAAPQTESKPAPSERADASAAPVPARMAPAAQRSTLERPAPEGMPGGGGPSGAVGAAGDDDRPLRLADLFEQRPEARSGSETGAGDAGEQTGSSRSASSGVPNQQAAGANAAGAQIASEQPAADRPAAEEQSSAQLETLASDLETALAAAKQDLKARSVTVSARVRQQAATARAGIRAQVGQAIKTIQAGQTDLLSDLSTKVTATHSLIDASLAIRKSEAIAAGLTSQKTVRGIFSGHRDSVDDTVKKKTKDAETLRDKKGEAVRQRNQADIKTAYRMGGAAMRRYPNTTRGAYIGGAAFDVAEATAVKMREQESEIVNAIKENTEPLPQYFRAQGAKALEGFDVNLPKILESADSGVTKTHADQDKRAGEAHAQLNTVASQTRVEISSIGLEAVAQAAAFGPQVEGKLDAELGRVLKTIGAAPGDMMHRISPPIEEAITLLRTAENPDVDAAKALTGGLKDFIGNSIAAAVDAMEHAAAASSERFQGMHGSARQAMHAQLERTNKVWEGSRAGITKTTGTLHSNFDNAAGGSVSILRETLTGIENNIRDQLSPIVSQIGASFDHTLHDAEGKIDARINEGLAKNAEALTDLGGQMDEAVQQAAFEYDHPVLSSIEAGLEFLAGIIAGIIAILAVVAIFLAFGWIIATVFGISMLAAGLVILAGTVGFAIGLSLGARLAAGQGFGEALLGAVGDFGRSVPGMLYDMTGIPKLRKAFSDEPMTPYQRGKLIGEGGTELVLAIFMVRGAAKGIATSFRNLRFRPVVAPEIAAAPELAVPRTPPATAPVEPPVGLPGKGVGPIEPRPTGPVQVEPGAGVDTAPQPRPSAAPTQVEPRAGVDTAPQPRAPAGPTQAEPRVGVDRTPQSRPQAAPTQAEPRVGAPQSRAPGTPSQAEPRIGPSDEGVGAAEAQPRPSQAAAPDNVRQISSAERGRAGPQPQLKTQRPFTTADELAARREAARPTLPDVEPQVQAKPLQLAAGGEGRVVEPIEVGGAPENAAGAGGGPGMDIQAAAKPPAGGPRPLRSVPEGGRAPRQQISGEPARTPSGGGPRGPRPVRGTPEASPLEEPAPTQPKTAKPKTSAQEVEPAQEPKPGKPTEAQKPATGKAPEAKAPDEPAPGDLGKRASGRPRATPEPDTKPPTAKEIRRAEAMGNNKPKQYTRMGDVKRWLDYKAGGGKIETWDEWLKTSRGSRGGGPNHQAIQDRLAAGAQREVQVGDNAADAMWKKGQNGAARDTYHQIGEPNPVRGDPVNRERVNFEQMYNHLRRAGKVVDMWFWDRNNPAATEPILKLTTDRPLTDQPDWIRALKPK